MGGDVDKGECFVKSLKEVVVKFRVEGSIVCEVFGDEFVDYFVGMRDNEVRLFDEVVMDW